MIKQVTDRADANPIERRITDGPMRIEAYAKAAIVAGAVVKTLKSGNLKASVKVDEFTGGKLHAIVTDADYKAQEAILTTLKKSGDKSYFITEEHVKDKEFRDRLITSGRLDLLGKHGAWIIDELDGSSSKKHGLYEWSISIGFVNKGLEHTKAAIFAPEVLGGPLFFAEKGKGSYMRLNNKTERTHVTSTEDLKDAYILFGQDSVLADSYPVNYALMGRLGGKVMSTNINGSCALAMGLVSAGKADAIVQPLQSPWDWAAGKLLVEEAGGKVIFYRMEKQGRPGTKERGRVLPVDRLKLEDYDPEDKAVGFIAGNGKIVDLIYEELLAASDLTFDY